MSGFSLFFACAKGPVPDDGESTAAPPLSEGTWTVTLDSVTDDSCSLTDEDWGVGTVTAGTVALSDDQNTFTFTPDDTGLDEATYDIDGDSFTGTSSTEASLHGACLLRIDYDDHGTILSDSSMSATNGLNLSADGFCTGVDTTWLPCSATFNLSWAYAGD